MPEGNEYKKNNKDYDETLYPLDHERSGQIRDFSLFNHFVKPLAAGVTATCVIDSCHSGSVLDLPYSFQPTSSGTIRMRESATSLSNLAFLTILAGSMLPTGFDNVTTDIENVTGGDVADYQGTGIEETEQDGFAIEDQQDGYQDAATDAVADPTDFGDDTSAADFTDNADVGDGYVPGDVISGEDHGGFGNNGDYGMGGGEDADPDVDCGCVQDVLGSLLEGGEDF